MALHDPQLCPAPFLSTGFATGRYGVKPSEGLWAVRSMPQDRKAHVGVNLRADWLRDGAGAGVAWRSGRAAVLGARRASESCERARACVRLRELARADLARIAIACRLSRTRRLVRPISIGQITRVVGGARPRTPWPTLNGTLTGPHPQKPAVLRVMRKEINLQTAPSGLGSRALHLPTSPSVAIWECVVLQLVHPTAARPAIL